MGKARTAVKVVGSGAVLAAKYGPQAKIAWDNGGKKAALAAGRRARSLTARRKALAQAATVKDGATLKVAPGGRTMYVVFAGDQPIAVHPPTDLPLEVVLAHADLARRVPADPPTRG